MTIPDILYGIWLAFMITMTLHYSSAVVRKYLVYVNVKKTLQEMEPDDYVRINKNGRLVQWIRNRYIFQTISEDVEAYVRYRMQEEDSYKEPFYIWMQKRKERSHV
jgi:hypothetical protein